MINTFSGGIHPPQYKEITSNIPVAVLPLPETAYIPLSQHTGAPAQPVVSAGDKVRTGQKIGDSPAFISSPIHASISGKVTSISMHPHPVGGMQKTIVIEREGDDWINMETRSSYENLNPEEIRHIIRTAGIVGLGGAAFPTAVKISPPEGVVIDSFILNGAECEPYLTADYRLMVENADEIITGMKILMHALGIRKGYIAIEDNKPLAVQKMKKAAPAGTEINVVSLRTKYPQGSEKQLIKAVLNREIPSGKLPPDVGVVVDNAATAMAVEEALMKGKPLVERVVTVTGPNIVKPQNLRVRIGTPIKNLIEFCGGGIEKISKVITGGPLMGIAQYSMETPVIKGTGGIIVFGPQDIRDSAETQCIRCGLCVDACPMGLLPGEIATYIENKRWEQAENLGISDCIECGACVYACPAQRPLVQLIKYGKAKKQVAAVV